MRTVIPSIVTCWVLLLAGTCAGASRGAAHGEPACPSEPPGRSRVEPYGRYDDSDSDGDGRDFRHLPPRHETRPYVSSGWTQPLMVLLNTPAKPEPRQTAAHFLRPAPTYARVASANGQPTQVYKQKLATNPLANIQFAQHGIRVQLRDNIYDTSDGTQLVLFIAELITGALRSGCSYYEGTTRVTPAKSSRWLRGLGALIRLTNEILFIINHPNNDHTHDVIWAGIDLIDLTQLVTGRDAATLTRLILGVEPPKLVDDKVKREAKMAPARIGLAILESVLACTSAANCFDFKPEIDPEGYKLALGLRSCLSILRLLFQPQDGLTYTALTGDLAYSMYRFAEGL